VLILSGLFVSNAMAETVPPWVQNTALWYGQGLISETEFLNMVKFLVESKIIVIENDELPDDPIESSSNILIPNGNAELGNTGFYIPLNLEIKKESTVVWVNDDIVPHTVQSIDDTGNIIGLFNSAPLKTGETFEHQFDESGVYTYYCSFHPWRVGSVTVR
jgi:hypothetical protein